MKVTAAIVNETVAMAATVGGCAQNPAKLEAAIQTICTREDASIEEFKDYIVKVRAAWNAFIEAETTRGNREMRARGGMRGSVGRV